MEGVLYKWTNYLSGECRPPCVRCSRRRPSLAGGRDPRVGYRVKPAARVRCGVHPNLATWAGGGLAWAAAQLQGAECQQPLDSRVSTQTLSLGTFRVIPLQTEVVELKLRSPKPSSVRWRSAFSLPNISFVSELCHKVSVDISNRVLVLLSTMA